MRFGPDVDDGLLDDGADLLGRDGRARQVRLAHQHDELLAAVAGDGVRLANRALDGARERLERLVAARVPVRVVEALEMVDVDHDDRQVRSVPAARGELAIQERIEEARVVQAGQRVRHREPFHRLDQSGVGETERHLLCNACRKLLARRVERIDLGPDEVDHTD